MYFYHNSLIVSQKVALNYFDLVMDIMSFNFEVYVRFETREDLTAKALAIILFFNSSALKLLI